jgi:hypothetical protein
MQYPYNKQEEAQLQVKALAELLNVVGSPTHLAFMLNIPFSTVMGWIDRKRISKYGAQLVEEHETLGKQFKAVYLRPDLARRPIPVRHNTK